MIHTVTDNSTGMIVFASNYYSVKQIKLKWNIGYTIDSIQMENKLVEEQ